MGTAPLILWVPSQLVAETEPSLHLSPSGPAFFCASYRVLSTSPCPTPGPLSPVEYQLSRFLENKRRVKWRVWILTQGKNSILKTLWFVFYYCYYFGHTLRHVESEFPAQEWNSGPLQGKRGVLATGPPGKSLGFGLNMVFSVTLF